MAAKKTKKAKQKNTFLPFSLSLQHLVFFGGIVVVLLASFILFRTIVNPNNENVSPSPSASEQTVLPPAPPVQGEITQQSAKTTTKPYTVQNGDTLWSIAEKNLGSGYKWQEIAKLNNLSKASTIHSGNVIQLPASDTSLGKGQVTTANTQSTENAPDTIQVGSTYTIKHNDSLWSIAQRAYKNPYKWVKIAEYNKILHPNTIHKDNKIFIPPLD